MEPRQVVEAAERIRGEVGRVVIGQNHVLNLLLVALVAEGHVLLEGVPGTAKTLLARTLAQVLGVEWGRIQFTPDLMPGDVIGSNLFDFASNRFHLQKGPVFTQLLLADEINRTPPKTQAALLEAMQEHSVTIDGTTYPLPDGFMVVATQNPIEQEGTYPLPEAQLDRFLFKVDVGYPTVEQERELVGLHGSRSARTRLASFELECVVEPEFLPAAREAARAVHVSEEVVHYVVDLVRATRSHPALQSGASPRAASALAAAVRAYALLSGRDYVIPDDVKRLARATLAHRTLLAPGSEIEGASRAEVLKEIVAATPAPK